MNIELTSEEKICFSMRLWLLLNIPFNMFRHFDSFLVMFGVRKVDVEKVCKMDVNMLHQVNNTNVIRYEFQFTRRSRQMMKEHFHLCVKVRRRVCNIYFNMKDRRKEIQRNSFWFWFWIREFAESETRVIVLLLQMLFTWAKSLISNGKNSDFCVIPINS